MTTGPSAASSRWRIEDGYIENESLEQPQEDLCGARVAGLGHQRWHLGLRGRLCFYAHCNTYSDACADSHSWVDAYANSYSCTDAYANSHPGGNAQRHHALAEQRHRGRPSFHFDGERLELCPGFRGAVERQRPDDNVC